MKKSFATLLTLLSCSAAHALPLGNPADASLLCDGLFIEGHCYDFCEPDISWCDAYSVRLGYYGDFVFNRHLEVNEHHQHDDIEKTEMYTNAGYIALNLFDRIDLFSTVGASYLWIDTNESAFGGTAGQRLVLETDTSFSWSIGARYTILECGCTLFGVEAQYFSACPSVTRVTLAEESSVYPSSNVVLKYHEWQVGVGLSHRIWNLVPYIGIKASGVCANFNNALVSVPTAPNPLELRDLNNQRYAGYAFGVSLVDCERMSLTVEARFPDEKALYASGQVRF
ncbi:MAG: Major outer membrane porin [Chlamydiales bacterium]|nr:Major outer membrane porin [Chlamydiales bacterium]